MTKMKTAWKVGPPRILEVARARSAKSVSLGWGFGGGKGGCTGC